MILKTTGSSLPVDGGNSLDDVPHDAPGHKAAGIEPALAVAGEIAHRYGISALSALLASATTAATQGDISVAVLGRFKAGKSSFLNDFFGRDILPVGVVPVTAAITEIRYGPIERAQVRYADGQSTDIPVRRIGDYISEKENPQNTKSVDRISVELPELLRYRGLKFVDTPGLESALAHNTQASVDWLPNVGLALVAVSVDPPLSQRDIELLRSLYQYTPKVVVLLTKADLLNDTELAEVMDFVRAQLSKHLSGMPQVFPYSTKRGFEHFRQALEIMLVGDTLEHFSEDRDAIIVRKVESVLRECGEYLNLSLKAAETAQADRQDLKQQVIGEKEALDDVKSQVRAVVQSVAARTRPLVSDRLELHQSALETVLIADFERRFPGWTASLAKMLSQFEEWLAEALRRELTELSIRERAAFIEPLRKVQRQTFRTLQQFRDRLSERTMQAFGVPLRTTETEITVREPTTPNVRVGRVFDRNWELLSPVLPVWAIRTAVHRHFLATISRAVYQNISRLSSQWEESVNGALWSVEKEAGSRLEDLIGTVQSLIEGAADDRVPAIQIDLNRISRAQATLQ